MTLSMYVQKPLKKIHTRNSVGITVQAISRGVLWAALLGAILPLRRRYFTTKNIISAIRNTNHSVQNHHSHMPVSSVERASSVAPSERSHHWCNTRFSALRGFSPSVRWCDELLSMLDMDWSDPV